MLFTFEKILFLLMTAVSLGITYFTFRRMIKIIGRGNGNLHFEDLISRISESLSVLITQKTVLKNRPLIGVIHTGIAWAFILYLLVNIGDILTGFISDFHFLGTGLIGDLYRLFVDVFSILALIGMVVLLLRRFVLNSEHLQVEKNVLLHSDANSGMRKDSLIVGFFIIFHTGFRFLGETFTLQLQNQTDVWQPFASLVSASWEGLSPDASLWMQHISWWLAIGLILAFIPYFPQSKHIHLIMGPINYLTRPRRESYGQMDNLNFEDEELEQFGVANLEHLHKTQLVDAYACIMCYRCQDACPAYITGKELSPATLEINKRYYIKDHQKQLAKGEASAEGLIEYGLSESALWACTSCAACVEVCPVGNEPMMDILEMRRDRVLMESAFPKQLQNAFNGMERNQNPWNMNEDRLKWAKEDTSLRVPTVEENPDFEILYWVGCAGAFDQRGQKIARAFTRILNHAGVNFAVLGNQETCTGDSARRAGNEYLFSMMAEANVETLNTAKVKKIVATCPHCVHTLKNEYGSFGGNYEVIHHSQFISALMAEGKVQTNKSAETVTFHDPCYLGRHNNVYDEPRRDLQWSGYKLNEMERNKTNSFCCGAGGAQMWKEEEPGKQAVRQNRFKEAVDTGANTVGTGCPFCLTMLGDAANELQSDVQVKDIAMLIEESLSSSNKINR
ncbi:MAG: 4Fe-4S dicluster domain-containing protein [Caldithrix sp.]|nr:4Fe-4S dicluster domain-containing protein [Caldithrix sp.]